MDEVVGVKCQQPGWLEAPLEHLLVPELHCGLEQKALMCRRTCPT